MAKKAQIEKLINVEFGREDMNALAAKVNELVDQANED